MFRDAKKELERLNQQLLEAEDDAQEQEEYENPPLEEDPDDSVWEENEEDWEEHEDEDDANWEEDTIDLSDGFELPPRRKPDRTLQAAILLLITGLVLLTAWLIAKRRGLI